MKCTVKTFGITRDITGTREVELEVAEGTTVHEFKQALFKQYPRLATLTSLFIAVNHAYAEDGQVLAVGDEIALIPPVAGG
ncbi:MAG: molybdopterin converting factor subunit 1 [Cyclobacteriaceae bacterium]|nr:MAG: molybdopterin converting factor subunit 1 [Cyclobacteriaceae bacterium]